jgi:catechol 2,3-dioxygenase-like lactoylglutathione lyase family enzyme
MTKTSRRTLASTPLLVVSDLQRAARFYEQVLGYVDVAFFGDPPSFCMLHRDEHDLMLALAEAPDHVHPHGRFGVWDVHLRVADLDLERQAMAAAGAKLVGEERVTEYGMREIEVEDPDGHRICLGQDLEPRPEDLPKLAR